MSAVALNSAGGSESAAPDISQPDFKEAERFLTLLDESAEKFTFQTFTDKKPKPTPDPLVKTFNGSLSEHRHELTKLNNKGAGAFVTVNETDLKGRKKENIVRIRAVFRELDRPGTPSTPIEPHFIVESSPGKFHEYYLVEGLENDQFEGVQQTFIDQYGSDSNAKDVSRVLRLPGFYHLKDPDNPFKVRIVHESGKQSYAADELLNAIPPTERKKRYRKVQDLPRNGQLSSPAKVRSALDSIDPDESYTVWLRNGMAIHHETNGSVEGFQVWDGWSAKGLLYKEGECLCKWDGFDANRADGVRIGTLFYEAKRAGWDETQLENVYESIVETAIEDSADDPGATLEVDVTEALSWFKTNQPADFSRFRSRFKKANKDIKRVATS